MNLLAHLHLGGSLAPAEAAGNLAADYCSGPGSDSYGLGVRVHQAIDSFTDAHPLVRDARSLFDGAFRRFGGVLTDLAFDYCLSHSWDGWMPTVSLDRFIDTRLETILHSATDLPMDAAKVIRLMHSERWLHRYRDIDGIGETIARIARRRPVAQAMSGGERIIAERSDELAAIFRTFYPELVAHVSGLPRTASS